MEILFLILSIVFFILWNKEKKSSKAKADQASETLAAANKRLDELSKYQDIRDVEAHCKSSGKAQNRRRNRSVQKHRSMRT